MSNETKANENPVYTNPAGKDHVSLPGTSAALWAAVGKSPTEGVQNLATQLGIDPVCLANQLANEAVGETKVTRKAWTEVKDWPVWASLLVLPAIIFLLAWAGNWLLYNFGAAPGLISVVVARTNHPSGYVLRSEDLTMSWAPQGGDYITATAGLVGAVLAQDARAGKPLAATGVLRQQIQLSNSVPMGSIIARNALSATLSPYQSDAVLRIDDVAGLTAKNDLIAGHTLLNTSVDWRKATGALAVVANLQLNAGRVLRAADVITQCLPTNADYFTSVVQIEGTILAQDAAPGTPLRYQQVQRAQVQTTQTITEGTVIASSAVTLTLMTYDPDLATELGQVVGQTARMNLPRGYGILPVAVGRAGPTTVAAQMCDLPKPK